MIQIVQLLLAFPKLLELFFKLNDLLEQEILDRQYVRSKSRIRDWVRDGATKQG